MPLVRVVDLGHDLTSKVPLDAFGAKRIRALVFGTAQEIASLSTPAAIFELAVLVFLPVSLKVKVVARLAHWHTQRRMANEETLKKTD